MENKCTIISLDSETLANRVDPDVPPLLILMFSSQLSRTNPLLHSPGGKSACPSPFQFKECYEEYSTQTIVP